MECKATIGQVGNIDHENLSIGKAGRSRWLGRRPAASGLAGYGKNRALHTRRMGNLYLCGDEVSESPKGITPMAPRAGIVANLQANLVVELLVDRAKASVRARQSATPPIVRPKRR